MPPILALLLACRDAPVDTGSASVGTDASGGEASALAVGSAEIVPSLARYTEGCEAVLGPLPALSCDDVPAVPQQATTADGVVPLVDPTDAVADGTCDHPSILSSCVPGSRAGWVENAQGSRFYLLCRMNRTTTAAGLFDDIALIGRDETTGQTCMWGAYEDGAERAGDPIPRPGSADDNGYWADVPALGAIACRRCHDVNGIVDTPWIHDNLPPVDPVGPLDVLWEDVLANYDSSWHGTPAWIHPDAAPCLACHPLPQGLACFLGDDATGRLASPLLSPSRSVFPYNRWMDAYDPDTLLSEYGDVATWEATYGAAADRLLMCCGGLRDGCWDD